jgi:cellulose biosynthesis protein BcsQ
VIICVTAHKGGVGKTTTSIHLAVYLQCLAPTSLVDSDAIRASTKWAKRGDGKGAMHGKDRATLDDVTA